MKKLFCLFAAICCTVLFSAGLPEREKNWAAGPDKNWMIHYDEAIEKAKAEGKNILVWKVESDAPAYAKMQKEVLKKSKFKSFAANRYILLWIDAPKKKKLPPKQQQHNNEVSKQLKINAVPQMKIINIDGTVMGSSNAVKEKEVMNFLRKTSQKRGTLMKRETEE